MAEGTIKRLTDKGFGFINTGKEKDLFFHSSSVQGVSFEELREGQKVSYTEGQRSERPVCRERQAGVVLGGACQHFSQRIGCGRTPCPTEA